MGVTVTSAIVQGSLPAMAISLPFTFFGASGELMILGAGAAVISCVLSEEINRPATFFAFTLSGALLSGFGAPVLAWFLLKYLSEYNDGRMLMGLCALIIGFGTPLLPYLKKKIQEKLGGM